MNELTANLKTRCVGRYLVDMPEGMYVSGYAKVQGIDIEAKAMSLNAYQREIAQRETELNAIKSIHGYKSLYASGEARGKDTKYFIHLESEVADAASRVIEAYKWDRGYRIKMKVEGSDFTNPDQTSDPIVMQMTVKNDVPQKTSLVFGLLEKVRGRADDEIPAEPGLCFYGGFVPTKAGSEEEVSTLYTLKGQDDINFAFETTPDLRDSITLLQHADSPEARAALKAMDAKVIRKGTVELPGMKAQEWLFEGLKPGDGRGDTFSLRANEITSSPSSPFLSLDLTTGGQVQIQNQYVKLDKPSLTPGEAVALWDTVSRTLRPRPNGY
ncbi:T6SS immunity protein Tli4 family protein [Paraburkholderia caballeronis]|uniref:T6SS immunity protein Tli4 family protein n=2 Tax=Paraburkholderia caballeronis TaxID=416943 RepID=UPI0010668CAA|nr:T6SS immunity protein Tli4 family protein [Paraburkholderia caballeronis]